MSPQRPTPEVPWNLLGRYFAGQLPAAQQHALQRWIEASPEHAELMEELGRLWAEAPGSAQWWDVEAAIRRIAQPAAAPARIVRLPAFYREPQRPAWVRHLRRGVGIAATIGLIVGGTWAVRRQPWPRRAMATAMEVHTRRGQRITFHLPDGSEVTLGPASSIRYAVAQDRGPRVVVLDGQAYFSVMHQVSRPFTVRTAHALVRDLGTRFGVQAYAEDSVVAVAVQEGKVALGRAMVAGASAIGAPVVLAARDLGIVTAGGQVRAKHDADVTALLAWREGRLEFDHRPAAEVARELERWYDVDIAVDETLGQVLVHASLGGGQTMDQALANLAAALDARYLREGRHARLLTRIPQ